VFPIAGRIGEHWGPFFGSPKYSRFKACVCAILLTQSAPSIKVRF
jgi:hypothetical protein